MANAAHSCCASMEIAHEGCELAVFYQMPALLKGSSTDPVSQNGPTPQRFLSESSQNEILISASPPSGIVTSKDPLYLLFQVFRI